MKIKGFIHCYGTDNGQVIVLEQILRLKRSPLWDYTDELIIGVTGPDVMIPDEPKITHFHSERNNYEGCTLSRVYDECFKDECFVYYMHTKGASHTNLEDARPWRNKMETDIVDKYQTCIEGLQLGINTIGSQGIAESDRIFYAGNFWWARSDYIVGLRSPAQWTAQHIARGDHERWSYETWITQNQSYNYLFLSCGRHLLHGKGPRSLGSK